MSFYWLSVFLLCVFSFSVVVVWLFSGIGVCWCLLEVLLFGVKYWLEF